MNSSTSTTTQQYLHKHNIQSLIQSMYYKLLIEQPNNPIDYIKHNIDSIYNNSNDVTNNHKHYSTDELQLLYSMLDPLNHGTINKQSVIVGLNQLGVYDILSIDDIKYKQEEFITLCQTYINK